MCLCILSPLALSYFMYVFTLQLLSSAVCLAAFVVVASSAAVAYEQAPTPNSDKRPPNIILIMADDLGVEGLGCYGGTSYATPRLDKLAAEGMRFSHAYAQPLCTNTRIQLMTGNYNNRNWLYFGILDPRLKTIGHYMQDAGYHTCIAGKWQLQSYDPPDYPGAAMRRATGMHVENAGFDEYSLWHTGHTEDKGSRYADPVIYENGKFRQDTKGKYGPDLWVDFINDYVKRSTKRDKPFFVYYSMALPHWPMVPTPNSKEWSWPERRDEEDTRYFQDMVEYMDECVGRIVDNVDALGLQESTLILFYSDNGTHRKIRSQTKAGDVVGGKGLTTNAGTHVPLIARWPRRIEPRVNGNLVDSTDFVPTLLEAAGHSLPQKGEFDGISFYPQLVGQKSNPRPWVFCHYDPRPGWDKDQFSCSRFARDKRFKLYDDGQLFDVAADPLEHHAIERDSRASADARHKLSRVLFEMPKPENAPRDPLQFKPTQQASIVPKGSKLGLLWSEGTFTEGPTVAADGAILFSDVRENKIMRFDPKTGETTVFREDSGSANGLAHDAQGRLLACEGADGGPRRISITGSNGKVETLVRRWNGKRFNSPNDIAVAPDETIYFPDPRYRGTESREIDFEGVFLVKDGETHLATSNVERPNGIVISRDGKRAYVADNNNAYGGARALYLFDIKDDGTFANRRELFDFGMGRRGIDGMAIDSSGNIYATAGKGRDAGVYVFGPDGEHLAVIHVPDIPTNCTFGGPQDPTALFITAQVKDDGAGKTRFGLYRIRVANDGHWMFPRQD